MFKLNTIQSVTVYFFWSRNLVQEPIQLTGLKAKQSNPLRHSEGKGQAQFFKTDHK